MTVKLLTEHNLEFPILTGGCTGSYESTLVLSKCHHATAHWYILASTVEQVKYIIHDMRFPTM